MERRSKTLIIDIDGTLVHHGGNLLTQTFNEPKLLPGVADKFNEWDKKGYRIILMTGRRESMRQLTEEQLQQLGLFWDTLIMGVGGGPRVIINDLKPGSDEPMAIAINLPRNEGMIGIKI